MKKLILSVFIVLTVAVLGVGLTACNSATPQGQLSDLLFTHNHEVFKYDVKCYDVKTQKFADENGTYTARLDAFKKGSSVSFGSRTLENVGEGIRVTGELVYGDTVYNMGCYYTLVSGTSYMVPAYSFKIIKEKDVQTFEMQGRYEGSTFECERMIGKETLKGSIKLSGTIFDNNQIHQILRAIPSSTFSGRMNLSFSTPIASLNDFTSTNLTATGSSTAMIKTEYTDKVEAYKENGINCYRIKLTRSTEVKGIGHTLYYAIDEIKYEGWGMKNVLIKIVEPFTDAEKNSFEMHYDLISAELS